MTGTLTACPICVRENTGRMDSLRWLRAGVVSCRYHGEMLASDIPALSKDSTTHQRVRQEFDQTRSAADSEGKS